MNSLERSLIEKSGADNGWECVLESTSGLVCLASATHPVRVTITSSTTNTLPYILNFSENVDRIELERGLPSILFTGGVISAFNDETISVLLRRYAELIISLPDKPLDLFEAEVAAVFENEAGIPGTEAERIVQIRIGQDIYRKALVKYWQGQCAVTCITVPSVLKASHAKPWADSETDAERLNVYNGFLLSANLDSLFDSGLITFSDEGEGIISSELDQGQRIELDLAETITLRWIDLRHLSFLQWHREHVFIP